MSLSNKEGDMLKLRIEEASEESSSEDDLQTQAETKVCILSVQTVRP